MFHACPILSYFTSLQALEPQGLSGWRVCRVAWLLAIVHKTQIIPGNWLTSTLLCDRIVVSWEAICLTCFAMFD